MSYRVRIYYADQKLRHTGGSVQPIKITPNHLPQVNQGIFSPWQLKNHNSGQLL
jgi:hypothetical protein